MKVLDCESVASTYKSLEQIIGVTKKQLDSFFESFSYESSLDGCSQFDNYVFDRFKESTGEDVRLKSFDRTCWFHVTRTWPENTYKEGILPLGEAVELIWDFLFKIDGRSDRGEWLRFRKYVEEKCPRDHYRNKINSPLTGWGPFGILVREVAFCAKAMGYSDQLEIPEIVEDICKCYEYGQELQARFAKMTKRCIVKFYDNDTTLTNLRRALIYLYCKHHNLKLNQLCYVCYDGRGKKALPEQILNVGDLDQ